MRHPHPLSEEKLRSLSTQRLLQVLKYARRNLVAGRVCDSCGQDLLRCFEFREKVEEAAREERDRDEALTYFEQVKAILANREHVEKVA